MFYTESELHNFGFESVGSNVKISKKTSIYNPKKIKIGNNVRIDDFCVISAGKGGIEIGNNVHIAIFCSLIGQERIVMNNFSGLSSRVSIYSTWLPGDVKECKCSSQHVWQREGVGKPVCGKCDRPSERRGGVAK